jgi:hypothetical protein
MNEEQLLFLKLYYEQDREICLRRYDEEKLGVGMPTPKNNQSNQFVTNSKQLCDMHLLDLRDGNNNCWIINEAGKSEYEKQQKAAALDTLLKQSIIDSNESIKTMNDEILPESFRLQRRLTRSSLFLSGLSILFIAISTVLQYRDTTPQEVKLLKETVQQTSNTLKGIALYLKEIDSSIQRNGDTLKHH